MNNRNLGYDEAVSKEANISQAEADKAVRQYLARDCGGKWNLDALKIAHRELDSAEDALETALGYVQDAMQQVEDADKASDPHEIFYMQLADDGTSIRKWSRTQFEGARKCRVALTEKSA